MPSSFTLMCVFTAVVGLAAIWGISPLMWDAAGYVEEALLATYRIDITVNP